MKYLKPQHRTIDPRTARPATRATGTLRPGVYGTRVWKDLRDQVQRESGMRCQQCDTPGRVIVDHVVEMRDGGAPLDRNNLKALCWSCHAKKTRQAARDRVTQ